MIQQININMHHIKHMKTAFLTLALAAAALCGNVTAQETAAPAAAATAAVPAKLNTLQYISEARPAADAKFYVYLCSASWCPPCRAIMPKIVNEYDTLRAAGGEIILLCFDRTPQAGEAYVKKYGVKFPAVMADFRTASQLGLPGFTPPRGIPHVTFVTPDGKVMHAGFGGTMLNWRAIIAK